MCVKMAKSDNNIDSKQAAAKDNKFSKIACNFGSIGLGLGGLFWVLESAIHAFLFNESSFVQQLTAPTVNEIWMRLLVAFLLIGFGIFANIIVKRLSESERRMSEMLANVQLCTVMLDKDGTITYVNDFLLKMTGYEREEVIGGNWFDIFIPAELREEIRGVHKEVLSRNLKLVGHYTSELLTKSGERRLVAWSNTLFQYSSDGCIVGSTSLGEDITEKKEAQEHIQYLAKFPSENPNPVLRISSDGKILYGNDASLMLLNAWGCQRTDDLPELYYKMVEEALVSGKQSNIESHCPCGKTFLVVFAPVIDGGYVNIYGLDVTERKRAEEKLRQSREHYALAQEAANIGSWHWDLQTDKLYWSEQIEPMFGFERGKFRRTYEAFLECVHPDDLQFVINSVDSAVETDKKYDIEHRIIWPNGTIRWVSETGKIRHDENGKSVQMLGIVQDITERKQAEEKLLESEERFRLMMEQSSSVIEFYNIDGLQINVNRAYEELWDFPASRTINKFNVLESKEVEATGLMDYIKRAYAGQTVAVPEYEFDPSGETEAKGLGRKRWLSTRIYPLKDPNGNVKNVVITHDDISERRRAEEKEKQHQAELAHAARLSIMGQMASELAHEINQPLCAIMGRAESSLRMVKSIEPKNNDLADQIETIVRQTDRAAKIVSRIKHFAVKDTNVRSTVYVNEVVGEALDIIGYEIKKEGIKIDLDLDDPKPIQADPVQIEQVVLNLIQNGIEALQKTSQPKRKLTIGTRSLDGAVEVAVRDTGAGISEEDVENVFESFFTTKTRGLGIGLSISRSIIESHGGSLNFRENSTDGVTFYFTLPTNTKKL